MQHPIFRVGLTGACACVTGILIATFISPLFLKLSFRQTKLLSYFRIAILRVLEFNLFYRLLFAVLGILYINETQ